MPSDSPYRNAERAFLHGRGFDEVREHLVEMPALDCTVRVLDLGDTDATPVLFLHGSPNAGPTWIPLVSAMQSYGAFRCLLPDAPGFGLSTASTAAPRRHAEAVTATLDALDLPAAHLVASSYGSGVAARFFSDHPSRALSVVHHGCPGILPASPLPGPTMLLRFVWAILVMKLSGTSPAGTRPMWRTIGHGPSLDDGSFPDDVLQWYAALMRHTDTEAANGALMGGLRKGLGFDMEHFATAEELGASPPTSLFWGDNDTTGGVEAARALQALIPGSPLELLPGGGHLPWLDAPDAAARHTSAHILSNLPASRAKTGT